MRPGQNRDLRSAGALLIALLVVCSLAAAFGCAQAAGRNTAQGSMPLPEIKKDCSTCHLMDGTGRTDRLKEPLSALCLGCHPDRRAPSEHKVDIVPLMKVTGLPLTNGKMTCITCHDPHNNRYGGLLRLKETDLCLVCHPL